MATLTIVVPESSAVPAADIIAGAARRAGFTAEHEGTVEQYLAAYFAGELLQLYQSDRVDAVVREVAEAVPPPVRPRVRERAAEASPPERER
jgi:hypothetical protein